MLIINKQNDLKKKFSFSKDFIEKLVGITGGFFNNTDFENLVSSFEKEAKLIKYFTYSAESNLLRIFSASFDPISLLNDCIKYPHHIEILIAIAANSNYLTDIVVMNPEFLYQIFDTNYLQKPLVKATIDKELYEGINKFKSLRAKLNFLRSYKKRYTLNIGINDILGNIELEEATLRISIIAKGILKYLFEICYEEIFNKYEIEVQNKRYALCALGKLGGDELNYSSDVDLILFYDKNSETNKKHKKDYYEILSETAQLFTQSATEITDKGYIYRIDFRLRPDGKNSPLCRTINDYLRYYETRGEDWERQMLIKLSFIDGDISLYNSFSNYLQGYIYPSSFSTSPVEQIKRLRKSIENRVGDKFNIKLFTGGIRDIEFSVQALQLINGGKIKEVRTGSTLIALRVLQKYNIIKKHETELYKSAYIFYRKVEHFLQLMNDTQTHEIPADGELLDKLAGFMNFSSAKVFKQHLETFRKKVRHIYNTIIDKDASNLSIENNVLEKIFFLNKAAAEKNFNYLKTGTGLLEQKEFDSRIINMFHKIEPSLIKYLNQSQSPDKVLDNFVRIIKSTSNQSIWYYEFSNVKFFNMFLHLCEYSQKAVDLLSLDKSNAELLISRKVFTSDVKELFDNIKINKLFFILSVQFTLGLIDESKFSKILSDFIAHNINKLCAELNVKYNFFIAGLGSFGANEMNFSSDVDLIVVAEKIEGFPEIQSDFQKLLNEIKKELTLIDVDFRLRPEGKNSPLVWDIKAYENYLKSRARIWEFQAFSKLKFVSGNKLLFNKFKKILYHQLQNLEASVIKKELKEMFEKLRRKSYGSFESFFDLKKSKGGIINIEFIIQSIILCSPELFYKTIGSDTKQKIKKIIKSEEEFLELKNLLSIFKFLKTIELINQNTFNTKGSSLKDEDYTRKIIAAKMKFNNTAVFDKELKQCIQLNNSYLQKYLYC